jgi:hypothetical protein
MGSVLRGFQQQEGNGFCFAQKYVVESLEKGVVLQALVYREGKFQGFKEVVSADHSSEDRSFEKQISVFVEMAFSRHLFEKLREKEIEIPAMNHLVLLILSQNNCTPRIKLIRIIQHNQFIKFHSRNLRNRLHLFHKILISEVFLNKSYYLPNGVWDVRICEEFGNEIF